jgi:hypothetical protein
VLRYQLVTSGVPRGGQVLAGGVDALVKLSVAASVLLASGSVGYYYVVYLPDRDAGIAREQKLEKAKAELTRHVDQQRREAEQRAADERRANDQAEAKAAYQSCVALADRSYNAMWASTCKRLADKDAKDRADCVAKGSSFCDIYKQGDGSPSCSLPRVLASDLDTTHEKSRDRCLQESKSGLQ